MTSRLVYLLKMQIIVFIKLSPKRERMLEVINENIEVSNDGDNVFEKLTALSKLSVTRWTVPANFFNKVKSLYIFIFKDFIFSVIYFSIILTFHFGFGNNSF